MTLQKKTRRKVYEREKRSERKEDGRRQKMKGGVTEKGCADQQSSKDSLNTEM